jgi:tetratricopeptide (TPR) repeat protein
MKHPLSLLALAALTACAIAPLQPDVAAKAPALEGFGASDWRITTTSAAAQRLFTQGVLQAYAFNENEAVRQFKAALAADPACAMCAWGVAWQLGPNINAPARGDLTEARRYVIHALRHADRASARERALIEVMAVRYGEAKAADIRRDGPAAAGEVCRSGGGDGAAKIDPLDAAYARRLHALVLATPDDPDLLSLWSEAAMIATADDWWDADSGKPLPVIAEMVDRLERAQAKAAGHTGINHYLIHAADAGPAAARAVLAADRLGALAPASPHLVHMPSHIYARVGRFEDARRVNAQALEIEDALDAKQKEQGFTVSKDWRGHNTHFHWYGALMQGRGDEALAVARKLAARSAKRDSDFGEYFRSVPILTLMRLERWDAVLAEPLPSGERGMASVWGQHARGTALARLNRIAEARAALALAQAAYDKLSAAHPSQSDDDKGVRTFAEAPLSRLRAEVALAEKRADAALAEQAKAVAASKSSDAREPPTTGAGAMVALGDAQLALGRAADAEASFRADLAARPDNGWALRGLARALAAQGKAADAAAVRQRLDRVWADADAALKRS